MEQLVSKKDVANLLKDARSRCRMSVDEVAASLKSYGFEIVPKSMYNYESGTSSPPVPMFLALCRVYGIEDISTAIKGSFVRKIEVSPQEEYLVECFRKAMPEVQDAALRVLQPVEKDNTALSVG
jgi:DNA-binding XRE family transcriptional regulator